ncbi:MAG: hypothetical protein GC191_20455 [Azospirillum sp.]|nr:hypothetical protein [Azospirillum sp.]
MLALRVSGAALAVLLVLATGIQTADAAAAKKGPPACAAVSFRPVAAGVPDGDQDAGLYKSKYAKIELKALVKSGAPANYYMVINGKPPAALSGAIPKSAEPCLKSKHVAVPVKTIGGSCVGNRFRVVIDKSTGKSLALLFGLQGNDWYYCNGAVL